jgi:hypothetical protein
MAQALPFSSPGPLAFPRHCGASFIAVRGWFPLHGVGARGAGGVPLQPAGRVGVGGARDAPPRRDSRRRPGPVLRRRAAVHRRVRRARVPAAPGQPAHVAVDEPRAPAVGTGRSRPELRHAGRQRALCRRLQGQLRRKGLRHFPPLGSLEVHLATGNLELCV